MKKLGILVVGLMLLLPLSTAEDRIAEANRRCGFDVYSRYDLNGDCFIDPWNERNELIEDYKNRVIGFNCAMSITTLITKHIKNLRCNTILPPPSYHIPPPPTYQITHSSELRISEEEELHYFLHNQFNFPDWWGKSGYTCVHKSLEIYRQAREHGIKMYKVEVFNWDFGHSINAVKLNTGEWVFIENDLWTYKCVSRDAHCLNIKWRPKWIQIFDNITIQHEEIIIF